MTCIPPSLSPRTTGAGFLNFIWRHFSRTYLEVLNSLVYQRYKNNDGGGKISLTKGEEKHDHWGLIYGGGMFVAIAQDMIIREATNNRKRLDDLMKDLFKKYGGSNHGYSLSELRACMSELS